MILSPSPHRCPAAAHPGIGTQPKQLLDPESPLLTPVLPERYVHSLRFFLDRIYPREYLTTFFPEYVAVWDIYDGVHLMQ
jgi:hypothetical protein